MPQGLGIVLDFAVALGVAFGAGMVALRLRQPVIVGYLLAGVLVGPHALGLVHDPNQVNVLAELGVALLMFAVGVNNSLEEIRQVQMVAVLGGVLQVLATIGLGLAVGPYLGLDIPRSIFLGSVLALSSTMVVMRILQSRGEAYSLPGRVTLGILVVQDLSVVPMMVILPTLAVPSGNPWGDLALAGVKAAVFLLVTVFLGTRLVPALLFRVAATHSRELFLLAVLGLCLGAAIGTFLFGLSLAFGAFVAGLLVSESDLRHQILAEVVPLRDVFATLFFVSMGMLLNPVFVLEHLETLAIVVLLAVLGKGVISTLITMAFRYAGRIAVSVGVALAQMGEFSFVLAGLGLQRQLIPLELYDLIIATALVTMLFTPSLIAATPGIYRALARAPRLGGVLGEDAEPPAAEPVTRLTNHVVICGYGDVGEALAATLRTRNFKYFVIEYDPYIVRRLREEGVPTAYGDAGNIHVLAQANLPQARVLAVTMFDSITAELAVRNALAINPRLDVIARARTAYARETLVAAGAEEVVEPPFEAALEIIRHTLHRFGVSSQETQYLVNHLREERYRGRASTAL
ncbi:MAG: cation:proton antiporter [Bacteroidetes bacterium]|nr:cation:proton antiporter [Bacteroidota bacterium]